MNKKADIIEKNAAAAPGDGKAITKLCGMLGLAKKAGALIAGAELSLEAAKSGRTDALLLASDAAHNTTNKVARSPSTRSGSATASDGIAPSVPPH